MSTARRHYEQLLGAHYAWSVSRGGDPFARAQAWLVRYGLLDAESYLDLGAGFGAHTVPLARAGKRVTAVDFHRGLLDQLSEALGDAPGAVATHLGDLGAFLRDTDDAWDVVLCLGDTITHLADLRAVQAVLGAAASRLPMGGRLVLGYRDYSRFDLRGTARFIPVFQDETRSMLCFLEALDAGRLEVTDIVTTAAPDGLRTELSSYEKLRIAPAELARWASEHGLQLEHEGVESGQVVQIFRAER